MTTDSLTLATQAGAHATLSPAVLRLFGQATPTAEAIEAATPTARVYHYGPETASLFEAVSEVVYPSDGGTALKPQIREGWRTYNFEVEDLHTYIAGGLRVHNTSLPALVPRGATEIVYADTDGDGKWDKADYKLKDGVSETIHGRDTDGNGTTDLVKRIKLVPREELLGPQDKVVWEENYQGTSTVPSEKKIVGIEYAPGSLQGEDVGRTLGSVLGTALGGRSVFAQVGTATIASTLLQNVGELLHKGIDLSLLSLDGRAVSPLEAAVTDTFKDFGLDLVGNAKAQVINGLSGVLVGELADALNLQGFERGLFSTVGNTVTNQVLGNVAGMMGIPVPGFQTGANVNLLSGFGMANMGVNLANSLGGFFGSQLGNLAVAPKSPQAALFGSAAAAVGSYFGTILGAAAFGIPLIGPLIGAFAGQALGNLVGRGLWDDDRIARYTLATDANGIVQHGYPYLNDKANPALALHMAQTTKDTINSLYGSVGARIDPNHAFAPFTMGYYVNNHNQKIMHSVDTQHQRSLDLQEVQGLIAIAVDHAVANSEIMGGDLFTRRAYTASHREGLAQLSLDLQVGKDFTKYLENTSLINSMIVESPESGFSVGWIATLQRAKELGLDRLADFNAMEYLASYRDLENAFGRDKGNAEQHMIKSGIPEGRQVRFDSLQYLAANPGLAQALGGIDRDRAAIHYMDYGRNEGRQTQFDAYQYLAANPDLARWLGVNGTDAAMRHYIEHGYREKRSTSFDYKQYLAANPGLKEELGGVDPTTAAQHYIQTGLRDGLPTQFNNYSYLASYPDLWQAFKTNFGALHQHVLDHGLRPTTFDAYAYLNTYPDLQAVFGTDAEAAAVHFAASGRNESGRSAIWYGGPDERYVMGGAGSDTVSYAHVFTGMIIDLNAQRTWDGHSGNILNSIENAIGSGFADHIHGDAGTNSLDGGAGSDSIYGYQGNDRITGGLGNDDISGGAGDDTVSGGEGDDVIRGNEGSNTLYGDQGNDRVEGGAGSDVITGWFGNDTLFGAEGNDRIFGEEDHDFIGAGSGDDTVYGGSGNDDIYGEDGNDVLIGDSQDDQFSGGRGRDTFGFGVDDGRDTIRDFTAGGPEADVIAFNSGVMTSFAAVQAASSQQGADVLIAVTSNSSIRLQNVPLHTLSAANFSFS